MNLKTDKLALYLAQVKLHTPNNVSDSFLCLQPRSKIVEKRLDAIMNEYGLPPIELIIEHGKTPADGDKHDAQQCVDNICVLSTRADDCKPALSYSHMLSEYVGLVKLLIQVERQTIIEKAASLLLWMFYDSHNMSSLFAPEALAEPGRDGAAFQLNMFGHLNTLEYVLSMEVGMNDTMHQLDMLGHKLLCRLDREYLNKIFYRASFIKKAVLEIENQQPREQCDWLLEYEKNCVQSTSTECSSQDIGIPFDNDDFIPVCMKELELVEQMSCSYDYVNYDFILMQRFLKHHHPALAQVCLPRTSNHVVVDSHKASDCTPESVMESMSGELQSFIDAYCMANGEAFYLSHEELYNTITEALVSNRSNDDLSLELYNILGDDNLDLINKIITFYRPRMQQAKNEGHTMGKQAASNSMDSMLRIINQSRSGGSKGGGAKGPSIVVTTEKEKALRKDMRKVEKKINREMNKVAKAEASNHNANLTVEDLQNMRMKTVKNIIKASLQPSQQVLLREASRPVEKYPYVFDMLANIKSSASYVAGTRLLLPEGCERKEHRTHEEMVIPLLTAAGDTQAFLASFPRIGIDSQDEFIRLGFHGFASLNLIQSTVFNTAYGEENRNMLICAPTGAGKTNIAMLSILNVLKSHSLDGTVSTIRPDQFKIVYIAPMKALCAEMADSFARRLAKFKVNVRELTGDMQLTSREIMDTQMLVVTPEKWDVVTRKSLGDVQLLDLVRLIIIDEVHLLQSDRGHVLETLVARTIRYVERSQKFIRLVGLSATLPNYLDVSRFLHVDPYNGLFVFDERFRPVPLLKRFIGCKANNKAQLNQDMDEVAFTKVKHTLLQDNQVMVFVHSRNATMAMANFLLERAQAPTQGNEESVAFLFAADTSKMPGSDRIIARARYRNLSKFLLNGIGIHHAGMPRPERNIVERLFTAGVIRVLICTSTLAWGVNLPAHSVIIRGTEYYDPARGQFVDVDMLDVMQIFGRAGRPQFDSSGEATIITGHGRLAFYLSMLTNQLPIESTFLKRLTDNLNAEIVLGTVGTVAEAVEWLRYTYAYIRMFHNPIEYGLRIGSCGIEEGQVIDHLYSLVRASAETLDRAEMVRYSPLTGDGQLDETHLGRIASHFYIQHETMIYFKETLRDTMDYGHIFDMLSKSHEFQQLRCREDEIEHLETLRQSCPFHVKGAELSNTHTKVNVLLQASTTAAYSESHSLSSDLMYIQQNVSRLTRGLFEYVLKKGMPRLAQHLLNLTIMFEKKISVCDPPLQQLSGELPYEILHKLNHPTLASLYNLRTLPVDQIAALLRDKKHAASVQRLAMHIPQLEMEASVRPITRTILTVYVDVKPDFNWHDRFHSKAGLTFWMWIVDDRHDHIYHVEMGKLSKKQVVRKETQRFVFTIPLLDAQYLQDAYYVHSTFENWLGSESDVIVSCANLRLPEKYLPQTRLLDLSPLPVWALHNGLYESIYSFAYFNPLQTQIFHTLYHTDQSVLLGAPTGSGKTIAAEIALFRVFNKKSSNAKVVYIAPLKALVRERVDDWKAKIEANMGRRIVELTGDVTPDVGAINEADIIITTPEKWDGVSRGWPSRSYVRQVALIIIDEIHLLGEDRGPVLEMIVSRANFIARRTQETIRIVGLSTAVANAQDLAAWLNIKKNGLYNFSASVRPVPIEVHVTGFSGKHYCPRMNSMNKPAFRAIQKYSPEKPVIVFVSSRRQTRLTALDLIGLISTDSSAGGMSFMRMVPQELQMQLDTIQDSYLKHTLSFGIGMHHAGLRESDRKLVEHLFAQQKIQILVTTATLAWGVNLPAHAVIIKGTEYFDGKTGRYVDFPITDVLQMIGRAGRPQFDTSAVAVLFVHDVKKEYYQKFLYEPFPVESHLLDVFPDHLNAEIGSNTVRTKTEALEFLSSTYLYHRIFKNPSFYGVQLEDVDLDDEAGVNMRVMLFLSSYIDKCIATLVGDYCVQETEDETPTLVSTPLGRIASFYYLSHATVCLFQNELGPHGTELRELNLAEVVDLLSRAPEFATLPVRHNEEFMNDDLAKRVPISMARKAMDSPHTKTSLLLQAHISRLKLPVVDYYTDLKSVLDQALRVMQAMIDISALNGSLSTTLSIIGLQQSIMQASWPSDNQLLALLFDGELQPKHYKEDDSLNDATEYFHRATSRDDQMKAVIDPLPRLEFSLPALLQVVHQNPQRSMANLQNMLSQFQVASSVCGRVHRALCRLPFIQLDNMVLFEKDNIARPTPVSKEQTFKDDKDWVQLKADTHYVLHCTLSQARVDGNQSKAYCPRFPKPKSETWYLILGMPLTAQLVTMARVPSLRRSPTQMSLQLRTPSEQGARVAYMVYLVSDCYLELDQQYCVPVCVQ